MRLPRTGIEIWDGLPGSGKTYSGVREAVATICEERRPVYTNMPVKVPVLRRFLSIIGGDPIFARYLIPLGKEHLFRFVERNQKRADALEKGRIEGVKDAATLEAFMRENGPDVCEGRGANWLYPGSVVILDEFHRWADQRSQKRETPGLLTWATMHRHHLHRIIILTQDKMQVSLSFRRNAVQFFHFADKRKIPFLFGLKVPLVCFSREEFSTEMLEGKTTAESKPISTTVHFPTFYRGGAVFRCYESFSHVGGVGKLLDTLESVRDKVEGAKVTRTTMKDRRAPMRWLAAGVVLGTLLGMAGGAGGMWWWKRPTEAVVVKADGPKPKVSAWGTNRVRVDGKWIKPGESVGDWRLQHVTEDGAAWLSGTGTVHVDKRRSVVRVPPAAGSPGGEAPGAGSPQGGDTGS